MWGVLYTGCLVVWLNYGPARNRAWLVGDYLFLANLGLFSWVAAVADLGFHHRVCHTKIFLSNLVKLYSNLVKPNANNMISLKFSIKLETMTYYGIK
jgi:hypothetical protein